MQITVISRLLNIFIAVLALLLFSCSAKVVTEHRDVYIPVRCEVKNIARPAYNSDTVIMTFKTLEYVEILEAELKACNGDSD